MKKFLSYILIFTMIFTMIFSMSGISAVALGEDVNIDMDDFLDNNDDVIISTATVSVEDGTDAGYIINNEDETYTAVAYDGNEFIGWYNKETGELVSEEETVTLAEKGEFVAKFTDNNVLASPSAGYELGTVGQDILGDTWGKVSSNTWSYIKVNDTYAKSGNNSLCINGRNQRDIYANISGLEADTYYIVSYYWMLPKSVITDTATASDAYYGSSVGTTSATSNTIAYSEGIGGDYTGDKKIDFVGGQWNKVEYVFNSADYEALRIFFYYYSEYQTGNDIMYIDEFTVYKAPDQQAVATYKANVSAENGYAYALNTASVAYDTEISVCAAPYGGYVFDGWYEDGVKVSNEQIYTFNITSNRKLVAKSIPASDVTPDVNDDGALNLKDLVSLARYNAGWDVDVHKNFADVNGNGAVALTDVTLLAKNLAGWDVAEDMAAAKLALPEEDLTDENLANTLLAGNSEYYNKSTVINDGNKSRIANVFRKAQNGEDITIVGFGGSITEGARATAVENRYGERVAAWFTEQFPKITVTYKNAGIGSTTSLVGVHRMADDVLAHNPDLVIVDFTTNDSTGDTRYCAPYENVIRRLMEDENEIAVLSVIFGYVSNYSAENADNSNIRTSNALSAHLPSMIHYDIPVIDYFGSLWRYIDAGVVNWTDVAGDYIHPSDNGHLMAASAITTYLADVLADIDEIDEAVPELPVEYVFGNDVFKNATFLGPDDIEPTSTTNFAAGNAHGTKIQGWVCSSTDGGEITFVVEDVTSLSLFLQHKTDNSTGSITVNGKELVSNVNCNASSTGGYIWLSSLQFFDEPTTVTITVTCDGAFGLGPIGVTYAE